VGAAPRGRGGFSAIELLVSLALLSVIGVALGGAAVRYARGAPAGSRAAARLAADRIEEVRAHHCYDELATRFQGIEFDVAGTPDAYRLTRVTRILEPVEGGVTDLTLVSVEVFLPGVSEPIERTATLRAP
jgi:prepilin-type N-terminal cleavage/methylation domain-containing protein